MRHAHHLAGSGCYRLTSQLTRRWQITARAAVTSLLVVVTTVGTAAAAEPPAPGPKDRCPVCGMFVAPHPTWIAVVVFDDGSRASFDGPKDMFRFLLDLETYRPGTGRDRVAEIWVRDYYTTRSIDARSASFVLGTNVLGPMGRELVPVSTTDAALTLLEDHGGQRILTFDQVTVDLLP